MKTKLLWILLAFTSMVHAAAPRPAEPPFLAPLQQQAQAAHLSAEYLARFHYSPTPLDDAMSAKILDRYIKILDPEKYFFEQNDIDQLSVVRTKLDDAIYQEDLLIPFTIFHRFEQRVVERLAYARQLLKQGFDFNQNESYAFARDKAPWPKSADEARELWRKRVKNDWLRLKLAGKEDKAIRDTLNKRYDNSLTRIYKYKSEDVFQIFMSAYTESIEPHTDYLGGRAAADFDISMKLSLVGIGAVLQDKDEYTTIRELVPGSPAQQSGRLHVGDRIVGVGQGENGAITEVIGWRIDDVVTLIRGTKDSVVRIDVLPVDAGPDAKHNLITLVRNKINLEEQAAKKSVIPITTESGIRRVGVISLPVFYQDFEARRNGEKEFKSAARDVERLLAELKKDKVDSVLVDLRNNGGGALDEAIGLTSLFVGKGPVVQQRKANGEVSVEIGNRASPAWDGPLGVLINRASASASEIFAAAIQDYGRGIVIGEPSFGKGTVQAMISLDQLTHNKGPSFGELKMTMAQFFRINGSTTQLRGVVPDISLPAISDAEHFGESAFDNALPWTQIKAADYTPTSDLTSLFPQLQARHEARIATDKDFQALLEDVAELKVQRKKNVISLNEKERRTEKDQLESRLAAREKTNEKAIKKEAVRQKIPSQQDDGLQADEQNLNVDLAAEKSAKDAKDVLLNEAVRILDDEADLLKTNGKLVARILPRRPASKTTSQPEQENQP